jgi:uncharacterized protein
MQIENSFRVGAPIEKVWAYFLDVEEVVGCMPGAQLTEIVDDRNYKGKITVKLGPVALVYAGSVEMTERDEAGHTIVLSARAMEQRGKGAASATVTSHLEDGGGDTAVTIVTDLTIQGQAAQYGRGMIEDISQKLTDQFAKCLEANLEPAAPAAVGSETAAEPAPRPRQPVRADEAVGGFRLAASAVWGAIKRFFRRMGGRGGR